MLFEEAQWLGENLRRLNASEISPLCNIGSASEDYRRIEQPYIDAEIFAPLRKRNVEILHIDSKAEPGVDLIGDLNDPNFLARLTARKFNAAMCCNLLEHVLDPGAVCKMIVSILAPRGYVIVTVPRVFPYHKDPIDTMFRPAVAEIAALFPNCDLCAGEIVRASSYTHDLRRNPIAAFWLGVRMCVPFYRPKRWWKATQGGIRLTRGYKVTCVILRRRD